MNILTFSAFVLNVKYAIKIQCGISLKQQYSRILRMFQQTEDYIYIYIITLNSTQKLSNKYQVRPLELSLLLRTYVSLWIG